ncbi:hypothetical protein PF007_g28189 [Phytophthora fragariae]|uniref:Uncharacterized protein n=1 Tax=Phytophthora fragariae TaxID=53985 RepID=A0A6A4BCF9_9STRA|nr:hypothetical protein PF007_g28189 [Phytophthora fragariae]KAE9272725.1 hypothetical protein PF001_g27815 [Phytophthora fragariae]
MKSWSSFRWYLNFRSASFHVGFGVSVLIPAGTCLPLGSSSRSGVLSAVHLAGTLPSHSQLSFNKGAGSRGGSLTGESANAYRFCPALVCFVSESRCESRLTGVPEGTWGGG